MTSSRQGQIPPFGRTLFQRSRYANPPFLVAVCVGEGAFERARGWNGRDPDMAGLALPDEAPDRYVWPLSGSLGLIEWDQGPSDVLIARLAFCLHRAGALGVASLCLFEDPADWDEMFNPKTGKWERLRHTIHFYRFDARSTAHAA